MEGKQNTQAEQPNSAAGERKNLRPSMVAQAQGYKDRKQRADVILKVPHILLDKEGVLKQDEKNHSYVNPQSIPTAL